MKIADLFTSFFIDRRLLGIALIISLFGLVMIGSASSEISVQKYGSSFSFLVRHGVHLAIAVIVFLVATRIPFVVFEKLRFPILLVSLLLLVAVLIPGIGREVNGARRWVFIAGQGFQPSEIAKLAAIIYLATFLGKIPREEIKLKNLMPGIIVVLLLALLILIQPDFGTAVIVFTLSFGILYCAGMSYRLVFLSVFVSSIAFSFLLYLQPYRLQRFEAIMDPWGNAFGSGYQVTQALMAIGRGGWLGSGLGKSIQKFFYLPEAHTDFLIAVTIEELGLISCIVLLAFYSFLILKVASIARQSMLAGKLASGLFVYGVFFYLTAQSFISWGVNLVLLPTTGLSLPLFSYGGTNLVISYFLLGVVQRISQEVEDKKPHKLKAVIND